MRTFKIKQSKLKKEQDQTVGDRQRGTQETIIGTKDNTRNMAL